MADIFCSKCKKTLKDINFYTYKDGEKLGMCKKCQTMHIDNYNPETYLWLLEDMDVPYIDEEWVSLRDKAAAKANANKTLLTGMSVYGKYLSKMKLKQWMGYTWADTDMLRHDRDKKMAIAAAQNKAIAPDVLTQMLEDGEIGQAEYDTLSSEPIHVAPAEGFQYPVNNPGYMEIGVDLGAELTEEDKITMAMKWGRLYTGEEWVLLETFYTKMMESFDIQGAAREDTLKKICKTSLKMDQAIDAGDTDTFQKLSRVYDALMKSGKFTEAQNKEDGKGFVNSIGELVALCETEEGFIPRFDIEFPHDTVDRTIKDMNKYTYNLVTKDLGLDQLIQDHLKKMELQREMDIEEEKMLELSDEDEMETLVLEDADFEDYYADIEEQTNLDRQTKMGGKNGA